MATAFSKETGILANADSLPSSCLMAPPKTRKKLSPNPINKMEYQRSSRRKVVDTVVNIVTKMESLGWRPSKSKASVHASRTATAETWRQGPGSSQWASTATVHPIITVYNRHLSFIHIIFPSRLYLIRCNFPERRGSGVERSPIGWFLWKGWWRRKRRANTRGSPVGSTTKWIDYITRHAMSENSIYPRRFRLVSGMEQ